MILLAAGQILLRNFWGIGVVWVDPLLRVMVLWAGLFGAMAATRDNNHITVDVFSRLLTPAWRRRSRRLSGLFAMLVCSVLAYHGARFVWMDYQAGTTAFSEIPSWCCELVIPLAFTIMAWRFLRLAIWYEGDGA